MNASRGLHWTLGSVKAPPTFKACRERLSQRLGKGLQLMIPTLARPVELMTVDEPMLEPTTMTAKAMPSRRSAWSSGQLGAILSRPKLAPSGSLTIAKRPPGNSWGESISCAPRSSAFSNAASRSSICSRSAKNSATRRTPSDPFFRRRRCSARRAVSRCRAAAFAHLTKPSGPAEDRP